MKLLAIVLVFALVALAYAQRCAKYGEICKRSLDCCPDGGSPYCRYGRCTKWGEHPGEGATQDPCLLEPDCPSPCFLQADPSCHDCPAWAECPVDSKN